MNDRKEGHIDMILIALYKLMLILPLDNTVRLKGQELMARLRDYISYEFDIIEEIEEDVETEVSKL